MKKDATKKDTTKKDATKKDATMKDSTKKDATKKDATKKDAMSEVESAHCRVFFFSSTISLSQPDFELLHMRHMW